MIDEQPVELIQWYDAQVDDSWDTVEKVMKWGDTSLIVTEVGWVIKETKKMLIIAS